MGHETSVAEPFFAELSELGEKAVREQLAAGAWGKSGRKVKLAKLWLEDQERGRAVAQHVAIARGSEDAANRSADAAERSADVAADALAMARDANFRAAMAIALAAAALIAQVALVVLKWP